MTKTKKHAKTTTDACATIFALAMVQILAVPAHATDYDVGSLHIAQPWARATPKGATAGAGYMTITNRGTAPDRLTCVSSDRSAKCEIHDVTMENGVMKMRPVEGGLEIAAGETVALKPARLHLMFEDLKQRLDPGSKVEATLKFEKGGTIKIELPVVAIGAPPPNASGEGGTMMMKEGSGSMQNRGGSMMQMEKH